MTTAACTTRMVNCAQTTCVDQTCSFVERRKAIRAAITTARPVLSEQCSRHRKTRAGNKIWNQSVPVKGSIAEIYLSNHGIACEHTLMEEVRFHSAVRHETTDELLPALIARVHNRGGQFVGIHKTYLAPDGQTTAAVLPKETRRMMGPCNDAHVKLVPLTGFRLVVTDSVELALLAQQACPEIPVWSAMTLGNMKARVPRSVKEIILCAYSDGNSRAPASASTVIFEAVRAHLERGITPFTARPEPGTDFGDMLRMG